MLSFQALSPLGIHLVSGHVTMALPSLQVRTWLLTEPELSACLQTIAVRQTCQTLLRFLQLHFAYMLASFFFLIVEVQRQLSLHLSLKIGPA